MSQAESIVLQFSFFVVFALLGTVLSIKLRQPYVVGLLLFGMIAGPNVLGVITDKELILTFSELGAILLLFAVGIEFSVSRLLKYGFRAVLITLFKMLLLFFFGYETALYFGLDTTSALFVGAMISITSTAILYKIVVQKGMAKNPTLPLLFSMLIVEDIMAVAALAFFSSLGGTAPTYEDKIYSVLISLGLLGAFYFLVRRHATNAISRLTSTLSEEVLMFVSFSLCLVMSVVAGFIGLTPAIGAFLAGSIVASLPNSRAIERTIKPLLLMFAALFFLSLGMRIDPGLVVSNAAFAFVLTGIFVVVCFFSVLVLVYSTGAKAKDALFGASAMVVLGEFSLLIASVATDEHAALILSVGSFGVIATAIVSSFLLDRQQQLYELGQRRVPAWLLRTMGQLSAYLSGLVRDFSPSGNFWRASRVCWTCASGKLARIAVIVAAVALSRWVVSLMGLPPQQAVLLRASMLALGALPILYYLYGIFRDLRPVLDALSRTIARHRKDAKAETNILRDVAVAIALIVASVLLPDIVASLQLPSFFDFTDEALFVLALLFIWDAILHAGKLHRKIRK